MPCGVCWCVRGALLSLVPGVNPGTGGLQAARKRMALFMLLYVGPTLTIVNLKPQREHFQHFNSRKWEEEPIFSCRPASRFSLCKGYSKCHGIGSSKQFSHLNPPQLDDEWCNIQGPGSVQSESMFHRSKYFVKGEFVNFKVALCHFVSLCPLLSLDFYLLKIGCRKTQLSSISHVFSIKNRL